LPIFGPVAVHQNHRILLLLTFALAALAAAELDRWLRRAVRPGGDPGLPPAPPSAPPASSLRHTEPLEVVRGDRVGRAWLWAGAVVTLLAVGLGAAVAEPPPTVADPRPTLIVLAGLLAVVTAAASMGPSRYAGGLVLLLAATELLHAHARHFRHRPPEQAFPPVAGFAQLGEQAASFRMAAVGTTLLPNVAGLYGLRDARGSNPSMPHLYEVLIAPLFADRGPRTWSTEALTSSLPDLLGVRSVLVTAAELAARGVEPPRPLARLGATSELLVWPRPAALPPLSLPVSAVPFPPGDVRSALLAISDHREQVLVAGDLAWRAAEPRRSRLVRLATGPPGRIAARARLSERRLVLSNSYQDGWWRVLVDGERRDVVAVNVLFAGVWLEPTARSVVFFYAPRPVLAGAALAALGASAAAAWLLGAPRRRRPTLATSVGAPKPGR
jgi:hypothetical protein